MLGHQKKLKDCFLFFFFFFLLNLNCEFYRFFEILVLTISSAFSCLPSEVLSERTSAWLIPQTLKTIVQKCENPCETPHI